MNKFFIVLVFIATSSLSVSGQVNDAGLWTSLGLKSDLGKKFSLDGDVELRFNENVTELGTIYGEALLGYKFNKRLEGSIGYRLIGKRRFDDSFSIRHRVLLNLSYKKKFNKVTASFRARYQSQFSDIKRSENWRVPDDYFRFKATFKYDTDKKWTPFVSGESFYYLNRPGGPLFTEYRLSAGFEYEYSEKSAINLGYIFDREVNVSNPWTNYIVSIGWSYKL
ncbi:MAG: DUF2490 domain-containing protein [Bacteroidota bacterium]|jgi:hypothetical protein